MHASQVLLGAVAAITAVSMAPPMAASTFTTLYSFGGQPGDGVNPTCRLLNVGGFLYGTTDGGGTNYDGTLFKIDSATGAETILFNATAMLGLKPLVGVTKFRGQIYAPSSESFGYGGIFTVNPRTNQASAIYNFEGPPDGAAPDGQMLVVGNYLYGVTQAGGSDRDGAIYRIDPATGSEEIAYSFQGRLDGASPYGSLIIKSGVIFGTTTAAGFNNKGTIYSFNIATGVENVLHSFEGSKDGDTPSAGLTIKGNDLYGTTYSGGTPGSTGFGTVFKYDLLSGKEKVVYSFKGGTDGANPGSDLLYYNGALYGTTVAGGLGYGTIFKVDPKSETETVLYSFTGGVDGANPAAGLIQAGGHFYGTTKSGGTSQTGTVFQFDP